VCDTDRKKICLTSELPLPCKLVGSRPRVPGAFVLSVRLYPRPASYHVAQEKETEAVRRFFRSSLSLLFTVPAAFQPGRGSITARRRREIQRTWKAEDRTRQARHAVDSVVAPRARVHGFEREVSVEEF